MTLAYSVRADTPDEATLSTLFDASVKRIVLPMTREIGLADVRSLAALLKLLYRGKFDAVHSHSSKAGALARLAAFLRLEIGKSCYSPHGFAFLRCDVPENKRQFFLLIERALHKLGGKIAACSATEKLYAEQHLGKRRVYIAPISCCRSKTVRMAWAAAISSLAFRRYSRSNLSPQAKSRS